LHALLLPLRLHPGASVVPTRTEQSWEYSGPTKDLRYATPALNDAKRLLRDWIESRLAKLAKGIDERSLAANLNLELRHADLLCPRSEVSSSQVRCDFHPWYWSPVGFVQPKIQLTRPQKHGVLVLTTGFGVLCGTDMSAYVYEWRDSHWQRIWQNEQLVASGLAYSPQAINSVHVSPVDTKTGERLILTLGNMDWCSSTYYPVYQRLWRVAPGGKSELLLDQTLNAWLGDDPPQFGKVGVADVAIEFSKDGGFDPESPVYLATRHYRVSKDGLARVDPFAFDPRAFVEEWLDADWDVSSRWVAADSAAADLHASHERLRTRDGGSSLSLNNIPGEMGQQISRCQQDSSLWEMGMHLEAGALELGNVYFLVRWIPPNRFEMVDVRNEPRAGCDGPEPTGDEFSGIERLTWPAPRRTSHAS
jgi:hypothetical protein